MDGCVLGLTAEISNNRFDEHQEGLCLVRFAALMALDGLT